MKLEASIQICMHVCTTYVRKNAENMAGIHVVYTAGKYHKSMRMKPKIGKLVDGPE